MRSARKIGVETRAEGMDVSRTKKMNVFRDLPKIASKLVLKFVSRGCVTQLS